MVSIIYVNDKACNCEWENVRQKPSCLIQVQFQSEWERERERGRERENCRTERVERKGEREWVRRKRMERRKTNRGKDKRERGGRGLLWRQSTELYRPAAYLLHPWCVSVCVCVCVCVGEGGCCMMSTSALIHHTSCIRWPHLAAEGGCWEMGGWEGVQGKGGWWNWTNHSA